MRIRVRIQNSLAVGFRAQDSGEFVFVICREGFEKEIGQTFNVGDIIEVEATLKLL